MKLIFLTLTLGLAGASLVPAGQLGKMFGHSKDGGGTAQDAKQILTQGKDLLGYATLATDEGMKAIACMISMFPPEKVAKLAELSAKYHELDKDRKDGNLDAEQVKVASDVAREAAALDNDWQSYRKDQAKATRSAHARLGLMLVADAQAADQAPKTLAAIQSALAQIGNNPLQISNSMPLKHQAEVLSALATELPGQISSFTTVRKVAKSIADAEKVQLRPDPTPDQVRTKPQLQQSTKELTD